MAPNEIADIFGEDKNVQILDAGAGTGLVGEVLAERGYQFIDALEPCEDFAAFIKSKNIFKRCICDFLGTNQLDIEQDTYDAVISTGVFADNQANDNCFAELIRITKPGGYIIIIIGEEYLKCANLKNFEPAMENLELQGHWTVSKKIVPNYSKFTDSGNGIIYRLRVL